MKEKRKPRIMQDKNTFWDLRKSDVGAQFRWVKEYLSFLDA